MAIHELSENDLELEAVNKIVELGGYKAVNANNEKFGLEGTFGRKTTEEVVLPFALKNALKKLNPHLPNEAIDNAFYALCEGKSALGLVKANELFYRLIKEGVKVFFKDNNGIEKEETVRVIDWNNALGNALENEFLLLQQFKVSGENYNRRCDLIIFINGLPLVVIELKAFNKSLINAFTDNITDYKKSIPQLFWYNALIVASNGLQGKIGSITSSWEHFSEWKKINDAGEKGIIALDTIIKGVFEPARLLDIIENFILFQKKDGISKIISKNHQYLGVNSAIEAVKNKKELKGKLGVFWHTQGSGKSFSMVFWTQKILRKLSGNWTFLIVTDREDLDDQIYNNFVHCGAVIEKEVRATSRASLKKLLSEDHRNIFTMIQKFSTENQGETFEELSSRDDIIVIVDEAHRTQYNVLAMNMRKALPNASFIAFTGTPLMTDEKEKTKEVFGDYVSKYGFKESVEDGATVKLYYENRIPKLQIINMQLDDDLKKIVEDADLSDESEERFSKKYVKTYGLITNDDRLETIAKDVVDHFMTRGFMGKAMYIALDKATAVKMYDKVQKHWKLYIENLETQLLNCNPAHRQTTRDKIEYMQETDMAVIVSSAQNEEESIANKGADIKPHRSRMNKDNDLDGKFKDPNNELRIVFVCAMWITGFDAPSVSTLYLDKILKGHTLMQTIARANRVWRDKPDGIIVDYIGIFGALQKALATYGEIGNEDLDGKPIENKEELIKELAQTSLNMEKFLKNKNVDLKNLLTQKDKFKKYELAGIVAERVLESEKSKEEFFELVRKLKVLLKAILPDQRADEYLKQILVVSVIAHQIAEISSPLTPEEKYQEKRKIEELSQRVAQLLDSSISIDDYEIKDSKPFDLSQVNFDELKERFSIQDRQKTTLENLKSAVKKKMKELMQQNPTRSDYLDKFEELITKYNSGEIDTDKLFLELVSFSRSLEAEESRHIRENLSEEELVIFDKLTKPEPKLTKKEIEAVKEVAKELLETLKSEKLVVDWKKKQSTRAKVINAIENVCDKLPEAYDSNIFKNKCDDLYLYFYDNYPSAEPHLSC